MCFKNLTSRRNWEKAKAKFAKLGVDFKSKACFVDLAAKRFGHVNVDSMPCVTAPRGKIGGYYLTNQGRLTSVEELARLQG